MSAGRRFEGAVARKVALGHGVSGSLDVCAVPIGSMVVPFWGYHIGS